jgi:hypothetical protein
VREAQGIKDTDEDRRRDRNRKAMAEAYDKSSMKARPPAHLLLRFGLEPGTALFRHPLSKAFEWVADSDTPHLSAVLYLREPLLTLQIVVECCVCTGSTARRC